jgi:predicted RNase H-like HicB family nuclease
MNKKYTAIIRKSQMEYVAVCLELNVSSQGKDLIEVETNLRDAIELYLEDIKENPTIAINPIPMDELIEFLHDTSTNQSKPENDTHILKPLELHEVAAYA